jgi:hypothetical protein
MLTNKARERLAQAKAEASPLLSRLQRALQAQQRAATPTEKAQAACEVAAAEAAVLHGRLAELLSQPGSAADKLNTAKLLTEAATAAGRIHALERQALGLDAGEGASDKSDLETVLRELEARGEISAPKAAVSEAAQRERGAGTDA